VAVIGIGLLCLAAFIGLSEAAQPGDEISRAGALIESSVLTLLAAYGVLGALILASLKCDESCYDESGEWWHTLDAWQWPAQLVVAVAGFAAIVAAFAWTIRRRHRAASASMVVAAASFGAWAAFLAPLGNGLGI
jgi:hypothetical protein